jgi:hypothetical protein
MKISNKLFISILIEKLKKADESLGEIDSFLYYKGITDYNGFHKDKEKYETISKELELKYPELCNNLHKSWELTRETSLLLKELLDGILE